MEYTKVVAGITIKVSIPIGHPGFEKYFYEYIHPNLVEEAEKNDFKLRPEAELKDLAFNIMAPILLEDGADEEGFEGKFTDTMVREIVWDQISARLEEFDADYEKPMDKVKLAEKVDILKKGRAVYVKRRSSELKQSQPEDTNSEIYLQATREWNAMSDEEQNKFV